MTQYTSNVLNLELIRFLVEQDTAILTPPVMGKVADIELWYAKERGELESRTVDVEEAFTRASARRSRFWGDLREIAACSPGCISFTSQDVPCPRDAVINYVDVQTLRIMYESVSPGHAPGGHQQQSKAEQPKMTLLVDRLLEALNSTAAQTPNQQTLARLEQVLAEKPASYVLGRERAQKLTHHSSFIPICGHRNHSQVLSSLCTISNNKIAALDGNKLQNADQGCPGIAKCAQSKIHYIPISKPQTDSSLGDCSYLDTCHKMNSCRYVHYLQYVPESLVNNAAHRNQEKNQQSKLNQAICLYTRGFRCAGATAPQLPAQWIQCDVRKFDFTVLGKFSVVVADPAWNIRMNLPYGTCNDSELSNLPLDILQNEGIIFLWVTGRAIEVGKESLQKWGYEVCNEISWIKTNQLGRTIVTGRTGHWLNHSKEHLLAGIKGSPQWLNKQSDVDLIVSASRETSRKPDELYGMIERLVGPHARKLEIFGRDHNTRPGWFTIGNQINGENICEIDVKFKYRNSLRRRKSQRPIPHPTTV
ncbi:LADA_0G03554g1_1 [Lachancea dasiensis]|uniref:mRNA m(6)A methyltransferase n=1 Tax=Lachancea dasiensis TaxID=1072105 RepID=A0A1G4JS03_9SACH|nr:LADA_0G03554g1_1 [Lachancea dasiensis]